MHRIFLLLSTALGLLVALPARAQGIRPSDDAVLQTASDYEKLMVVQTVSTTQRTFVLRLGMQDGVTVGRRALFSTDKVSIVGECIQSSREYSLWKPWEPQANIPFRKGQIITYNNNLDSVWTKIPELQETLEEKKRQLLYIPEPYWALRFSLGKSLSESTTDTSAEQTPSRTSTQFEAVYNKHLYRKLDWGIGARFDKESGELEEGNVTLQSNRYMVYGEISFHFDPSEKTLNHLYAAAGMGMGMSNTKIDDAVSTGTSLLMPVVRVGFMTALSRNYNMLTEVVAESIASKEKFADGTQQNAQMINAKVAIGLRF